MEAAFGAVLERGRVVESSAEGARIESICREGVCTPLLPFFAGCSAEAGDLVYFFLFDDGKGLVISKA